jgi:hypothetical protein
MLLRDRPGGSATGRRLHSIWAVMKIPLAVGMAVAMCWMLGTYLSAVQTLPPGAVWPGASIWRTARWARIAYACAIGVGAVGCVYAILVLLLLRARQVREFYNPVD